MHKSTSAPNLTGPRTRGAVASEPTLEEKYFAAVDLYKYGRGQYGDPDYVRQGNKAACAREADCDVDTFIKILQRHEQGQPLVGTCGRTPTYSKDVLDKMTAKAQTKDRRGDSYTSDGKTFMNDLNRMAGYSSKTTVSESTKKRVMKMVIPESASGCYKTLERSRQLADLRNALSCIYMSRAASKGIDPRLIFGWDDMTTVLYSFADKPKL